MTPPKLPESSGKTEGATPSAVSLIEFPCFFPIKVMGKSVEGFAETISNLLLEQSPGFKPTQVEMRSSKNGTYLSLTCQVWVENQPQLDAIYRALSSNPLVSVVL